MPSDLSPFTVRELPIWKINYMVTIMVRGWGEATSPTNYIIFINAFLRGCLGGSVG